MSWKEIEFDNCLHSQLLIDHTGTYLQCISGHMRRQLSQYRFAMLALYIYLIDINFIQIIRGLSNDDYGAAAWVRAQYVFGLTFSYGKIMTIQHSWWDFLLIPMHWQIQFTPSVFLPLFIWAHSWWIIWMKHCNLIYVSFDYYLHL